MNALCKHMSYIFHIPHAACPTILSHPVFPFSSPPCSLTGVDPHRCLLSRGAFSVIHVSPSPSPWSLSSLSSSPWWCYGCTMGHLAAMETNPGNTGEGVKRHVSSVYPTHERPSEYWALLPITTKQQHVCTDKQTRTETKLGLMV